MSKCGVHL